MLGSQHQQKQQLAPMSHVNIANTSPLNSENILKNGYAKKKQKPLTAK